MKDSLHKYSTRADIASRDFFITSAARFVSTIGYTAVVVAIMLEIQRNFRDPGFGPWAITGYLALATLPAVLLAPWAGKLADTHDSRLLAGIAAGTSLAAAALMATSTHLLANPLPALFGLTVLLEAATVLGTPTWQALLPRIVGEDRTPRAMGNLQATLMLAGLVGPALGGLLTGAGGLPVVFWAAAAGYLGLLVGALLLRTRRHLRAESASLDTGRDSSKLSDGLRELSADRVLQVVLGSLVVVTLFGSAVNVFEVFLVRETLGGSEIDYGLLTSIIGAGLIAGSMLAGRIRSDQVRLAAFFGAAAGTSICFCIMGLAPTMLLLFLAGAAAGFGIGVLNAAFGALVIKRTAEHRRGQVSSITQALSRAAALGSLGLGGFLGSVFGPRIGFVASGSAALLASLCGAALLLLRFREQESVEQQLADRVE